MFLLIYCCYLSTWGARQFLENHFADTTIGRIRLLVDATFRRVRHLVEKNSQVRHSVEIVTSLFFDQTSYSAEHRIYQMSKRKNHEKSPDVQISVLIKMTL